MRRNLPLLGLLAAMASGCTDTASFPARRSFWGSPSAMYADEAGNVAIRGEILLDVRVIETYLARDPVLSGASPTGWSGIRNTSFGTEASRPAWLVSDSPQAAEAGLAQTGRLHSYALRQNPKTGAREQVVLPAYIITLKRVGWHLIEGAEGPPSGFHSLPPEASRSEEQAPVVVGLGPPAGDA